MATSLSSQDRRTRVRLTNTLFASQSMLTAAQTAIFTLMSIVAVEVSGREALAGLPTTALTLSTAAVALPMGLVMGRFGRRFGLSVSYGASVLGALVGVGAVALGSFPLLLLSAVMIGAGRAGGDQSRFAAGDMFPDGESGRMIGRVVFAGTVGAIVGPLLLGPGGALAVAFGLPQNAGAWMVGALLYGVAVLVTLTALYPEPNTLAAALPDEKPRQNPKAAALITAEGGRSLGALLRVPVVRLAVTSMLISQMTMVALMVITPLHMVHHAYGNEQVGWVITAHTLGMFAFSGFTGALIDRYGEVRVMLLGGLTLMAAAVVSPLSSSLPVLLVGLFLLGIGWNFGYIAGSSLLSNALRGVERARMQGAGDMFVAAAAALGSLSSGPIYYWGGYAGVAALVGVMTLLFLYVLRVMGAHGRTLRAEAAL